MSCPTFKVVAFGTANCGKTTAIRSFEQEKYVGGSYTTVSIDKISKKMCFAHKEYQLDIYDTPGVISRFSSCSSILFKSNAIIFFASYDNYDSISDIISEWRQKIDGVISPKEYISFLCICKSDLEKKEISEDQIEKCAESLNKDENQKIIDKNGVEVFKISTEYPDKGEITIDELFNRVGERIVKRFAPKLFK